ncbi:MAG: HEPN domain-containing protein [Candidatus Latescibacterota bacterium]
MRKDPLNEAKRWITQAKAELRDAEYLLEGDRYYLALFLAQQSAEKALKAFLFFREEEPVFSHSVSELLKLAQSLDADFTGLKDAKRLDDYYIPTRYPNGLPGAVPSTYFDDREEVETALSLSRRVIALVSGKIEDLGEI